MTEKPRTIGDTGMTVEEIRQWLYGLVIWLPLDPDGRGSLGAKIDGFIDTLESAQREADEAKKRAEKAEAQIAECEEANEALCEKIKSLSNHDTCGCSYDQRGDVCVHHSPQLTAALERAEKAEAQVAEMRAALEGCMLEVAHSDEPGALDGCPGCESLFRAKAALSSSSGNKALAVIEAAKEIKFGSYPAHGSGFVLIVREGNVDQLTRALAEFEGGGK